MSVAAREGAAFNIVRVSQDFSSDTVTPVLAYLRLARAGQKAFLLESAGGNELVGRYSFVGVDPIETLRVRDGKAFVVRGNKKTELTGNPFSAIRDYLARYKAQASPELPPFQGGAVGYVAYECVKYFEDIPTIDGDRDDACVMVFRNVVAFDHLTRRVFVIGNVFLDEETRKAGVRRAMDEALEIAERIFGGAPEDRPLKLPKNFDTDFEPPSSTAAMGKARFVKAVKIIKEHIRAGDIFQCVLSDQFKIPVTVDPFAIYRALRVANPSPYLFYLSLGEDALLGASPEMLTRTVGRRVQTSPIAGTRPRGLTKQEDKNLERDLLRSVKERAEHLMLVDLGRNDLGRVCEPGSVRVEDFMHVGRFSHVMHLVSLVEGTLRKNVDPWDALASCFPAGTLSGAPKIRAMQIIADLESVARHAYGGAVLYHDFAGDLDSCITIRSMFVRGRTGFVQAGAGVVGDSRPESEYDEVLHKSRALRCAVALAAGAAR